jgi:hypothetical protein
VTEPRPRSARSPVPEDEWETITVADFYKRYGKRFGFQSVEAVYRAIKDGRFPGHQNGHRWYVIMPAAQQWWEERQFEKIPEDQRPKPRPEPLDPRFQMMDQALKLVAKITDALQKPEAPA